MGKKVQFPKSRTVSDVEPVAPVEAQPAKAAEKVKRPKAPEEELAEIQQKAQALHQAKIEACARELQAILSKYGLTMEVGHQINLIPIQR